MIFDPCQSMIVYPSDPLAAETNLTKIKPLMKHIPQLKNELMKPRSFRSDRYSFSNLVSYFQGSGTKIVSKSCKIVIADEVDQWVVEKNLDNVNDLKKRTRSYSSCMQFFVCTPTTQDGKIWKEFLKSSQGYWYLRCQGCGGLTIRSCDINNLQFEAEYDERLRQYIVKENTIRLVCPKCRHEHLEEDKRRMNLQGGYIHTVPERILQFPGFQVGALASQNLSLCWKNIAMAQLEAGKKAEIEAQMNFDNSFRGLPWKRRVVTKEDFDKLRFHCWNESETPSLNNVEMIFLTPDTEDEKSVVGVFAVDVNDNLYMIEAKEVKHLFLTDDDRFKEEAVLSSKIETVEDMLKKEYLVENGTGILPTFMVIDRQGHRQGEVEYFAKRNKNVIMYQGTHLQSQMWKVSDNIQRLCLVSARKWQAHLIYYLYTQHKRSGNFLFFNPNVSDEVLKQIKCVQPDSSKKFGDNPEQWEPEKGAVHDFFDVVKMAYFAFDFAIKTMNRSRWRFCKSPLLLRRWEKVIKSEAEEQQKNGEIVKSI